MAKRPTGFGKASKQKKVKSEEPDAELNIELTDDVEDEELAEIYGLYTELQKQRDPKIARGLIHECDQLLRQRDSENKGLPDKFHVVYGGALLTLADDEDDAEKHKQFRDAGVERINVGLTSANNEALALAGVELLQYVHTQAKNGKLATAGEKIFKHAVNLLKKRKGQQHIELARAALILVQLVDDLDGIFDDAGEVAFDVLTTQASAGADKETQRIGHKGLGQYYLNQAGPLLETDKDASTELEKAATHLRASLNDEDPEAYVMLAETLLEMDTDYVEALKLLKKARMLGNEGLNEIIDELENS